MLRLIPFIALLLAVNAQAFAYKKHSLSAMGGFYSFSSPTSSLSGLGALDLSYAYRIKPKWDLQVNFANTLSSSFSTVIWGVDGGANYCFFNCMAKVEDIDSILEIIDYKRSGLKGGFGIGQRTLQLIGSSVAYSGPYLRLEYLYFKSEIFKILGRFQYSMFVSGTKSLDIRTLSLGVEYDL